MKLTDVQEGLIVRTIQRLDEMIRDVKDAARIIGDPSLKRKWRKPQSALKEISFSLPACTPSKKKNLKYPDYLCLSSTNYSTPTGTTFNLLLVA